MKILIVDDSPTIRLTLRKILEGLTHDDTHVEETDSGETALAAFKRTPPNVVFLDIELGKKDGNTVLRELLAIQPDAKVILATSAQPNDERVTDAIGQGAFGLIQKPLRRDDVARALAEIEHENRRTRRVQ